MKKLLSLLLIILLSSASAATVIAEDGYNYSYWGDTIPSTLGLSYAYTYNEFDLNAEFDIDNELDYEFEFEILEDISATEDEIFIIDSQTHSLTILNSDYKVISYNNEFTYSDELEIVYGQETTTLNSPKGVFVNERNIYIADTQNNRILKLDHDLIVVGEFSTPDDKTFDDIDYQPIKIVVDSADRIYVIAQGVFEGILELNYDGSFNRYTGVNEISVNPVDIFWRQFMTDAQLDQLELYLPTEFTNLAMSEKGFVYTTSKPDKNGYSLSMIQILNAKGIDILKRNGYSEPQGDLEYIQFSGEVVDGPSSLVAVAVNDFGVYTVLDQKRSRLFTYDNDGYLLYISGDEGTLDGKLQLPVAVEYFGEDVLILDQGSKSLLVYKLTEFGQLVNDATEHHYYGRFEEASEKWSEVVKTNSNYELAYIGIGKSLLRQGEYKEAMDNFYLGKDKVYYSKAFSYYRDELLEKNFSLIMTLVVGGSIGIIIRSIWKSRKLERED